MEQLPPAHNAALPRCQLGDQHIRMARCRTFDSLYVYIVRHPRRVARILLPVCDVGDGVATEECRDRVAPVVEDAAQVAADERDVCE